MIIYTKILHNLRIQGHSELILLFSLRCLAANNIELPQTVPNICLSCWVMLAHSGHQTAVASCISAGSAFASAISGFGNSKKVVGPGWRQRPPRRGCHRSCLSTSSEEDGQRRALVSHQLLCEVSGAAGGSKVGGLG